MKSPLTALNDRVDQLDTKIGLLDAKIEKLETDMTTKLSLLEDTITRDLSATEDRIVAKLTELLRSPSM